MQIYIFPNGFTVERCVKNEIREERRDHFRDDDAYVACALAPQVDGHLIALVSHASGCLADEPHGLWLDIVGVSGQGSGDCAFREPQLSGYVDNGGVFHAMVVFLQS